MTHLKLDGITKQYNDVVAVDDMNLDVKDGEFVSLIGPSGCGKSTTLETVAGLTKPTTGLIEIAGTDVTNKPPKDRDIAMVFQNIALFPHMTVRENVTFGLRLKNYEETEIDERVEQAADILQINGMLDRMPDELSGGQRQRVAIGRAIVLDPEVFLMDEPLANLDAKLRVHMRTEIQRLQQELDVTTVYVTHDQAEAMTMSDRIAIINDGKLQQFAAPLECYNRPANLFVAGFVGSPSMRLITGHIGNGSFTGSELGVTIDVPPSVDVADGDDVILGVRPEDVYLEGHRLTNTATDTVTLEVDVVQPMGDELVVYLRPDGSDVAFEADLDETEQTASKTDQLLMTIESSVDIEAGQSVGIALDRAQVHLFDAATGKALAHGLEQQTKPA